MRKFQRAALVAAAVAGLSLFGAGASFAGENDAPPSISAVANSSANAVAVGGNFVQPQGQPEGQPEEQPQAQGQPEEQPQGQPQEEQKNDEPEQGYGEHGGEQ
ncbi:MULTISPECIES: hypothetical protein [unclassified Streptomyces]|uniref:hypothetical protein n=1 Tax=unclassified Streptomyces TaxID=2593676 RepID=UPI0011725BC9|nr:MULTISPECIES: hypothetical protein [unclassified Streptomyces]MDI1458018.1 hypothetical protein [Streptomyces sp. ATE26]GEK00867.1 hypothetical protein TNCT1_31430 [Streptomyces sp. 1-11]